MREKIRKLSEKVENRVKTSAAYVEFLRRRDKLANGILQKLLAFLTVLSPFLAYFCLKPSNYGVSYGVINHPVASTR